MPHMSAESSTSKLPSNGFGVQVRSKGPPATGACGGSGLPGGGGVGGGEGGSGGGGGMAREAALTSSNELTVSSASEASPRREHCSSGWRIRAPSITYPEWLRFTIPGAHLCPSYTWVE
tara:strand:- start:642 stop:998 length:357 start_codon:yes stop_codon:yes gene_type:complete